MNLKNNGLSHMSLSKRKITLLMGILLLMMACSFPTNVTTALPTVTPGPVSSPEPVFTPTPANPVSPTPSGLSSSSSPSCYLGSWETKDISGLVKSILAANNIQNVQYTGSSGSLTLSFSTDGKMTFKATQYHSLYSAQLGILPVTVDVTIDGTGSGDYKVNSSGSLDVTNPDFGAITLSAKAASIQVMPPTPLKTIIPALQGDLSGQTADLGSTCSQSGLTFDTGLSGVPPLSFTRIQH
jgi:hypothetical protein